METICSSHKSLYRDLPLSEDHKIREPPPVSILSWSRGGLVNGKPPFYKFWGTCKHTQNKAKAISAKLLVYTLKNKLE